MRERAEPRQAGEQAKAAILRASRRLRFPFNRTRDIWYGYARRICVKEMDRLRKEARGIEIVCAVTKIEVLRNRMLALGPPDSREVGILTRLWARLAVDNARLDAADSVSAGDLDMRINLNSESAAR